MIDLNESSHDQWEMELTALLDNRSSQGKEESTQNNLLLRRFFSELSSSPCLTSEEEYQLTHQAQASWQQIRALCAHYPDAVVDRMRNEHVVPPAAQLCEQDVIILLENGEMLLQRANLPEHRSAAVSHWCIHLRTALHTFRAARDVLVQRNLRLVFKITRQYRNATITQLDLIQEGVFGLMRAIEKFDPTKGFKLSTYAGWWIRQAISRALKPTVRSVRLSTTMAHTGTPDVATIPVTLVSLDTPITETDSLSLAEILSHPDDITPEEVLLQGDQRRRLYRGLTQLAPRDAAVLRLRFGLADGHPYTLEEVGRHLQMSREQVRQREERALTRLRHLFQALDAEQRPTARKTVKGVSL